jgi:hypothetical protein
MVSRCRPRYQIPKRQGSSQRHSFSPEQDVEPTREPACASKIGLGDVNAAPADEIAESVTCEFALAPRDGDGIFTPDFTVSFVILGRDRLLEKLDLMRFHEPTHADGRSGAVGVVGVDKQADPRTDRRSDDVEALNIVGEAEQTDFDFEELEASVSVAGSLLFERAQHGWHVAEIVGVVAAGRVGGDAVTEASPSIFQTGSPAAWPAMSQRAISTAEIASI